MIRYQYFLIIFTLIIGCSAKLDDHDEQTNVKDGVDSIYYTSGHIKSVGNYKGGNKVGWHYDYYDSATNQVKEASFYDLNSKGDNEIKQLIIYSKRGLKSYDLKYDMNPYQIDAPDTVLQGDTLRLRVSFKSPKYPMIRAYIGELDPLLGVVQGDVTHFLGEENLVLVEKFADQSGYNTIKGHLIDSNIEPAVHDQYGPYGTEKGIITYFEYNYYVVPQSDI